MVLRENRAELLNHGYFVPESETKRGAHHALAEGLAGLDVGEHRQPLVTKSIRAIAETASETIIISFKLWRESSESRKHGKVFFSQIRELNCEPKLVLFPRNQPQWINSSYAFSVMSFRRSDPFQSAAWGFAQSPGSRFSRWVELAMVMHWNSSLSFYQRNHRLRRDNRVRQERRHQFIAIPEFRDTTQ